MIKSMRTEPRIFVFESHPGLRRRCCSIIEQAQYVPIATGSLDEAKRLLTDPSIMTLLISTQAEGIVLSQFIRNNMLAVPPLLALIHRDETDPYTESLKLDADGFLLHPFSVTSFKSTLSVSVHLSVLRERLSMNEHGTACAIPNARRVASAIHSLSGFYQFECIKDLLAVEVRRAKRYGFPLALLLVGLDPLPTSEAAQFSVPFSRAQKEITGGLAAAIGKSIRDVDIPVHYAEGRILVFLPHTLLPGAEEVGKRIKRRFRRILYRGSQLTAQLTLSVGVAGMVEGESITFSKLIKDALAALKAAQLKGGDRVMKRSYQRRLP